MLKINCVFLLFLTYAVRIILSSVENFIQCGELKKLLYKNYYYIKNFFLSKHIIMVKLTTHELRLIAGKRGIKNYQNMSRETLLSTLDESECIFENLAQNGLKQIAKMQNLSQNELKQIIKVQNLSQNELEQIAKMRSIKKNNY